MTLTPLQLKRRIVEMSQAIDRATSPYLRNTYTEHRSRYQHLLRNATNQSRGGHHGQDKVRSTRKARRA